VAEVLVNHQKIYRAALRRLCGINVPAEGMRSREARQRRRGALQDSGVPARLQLFDHVAGGLWAQARFKTLNPRGMMRGGDEIHRFRERRYLQMYEPRGTWNATALRVAPAATSSTNTLTASSVPFFLPSCRAQGSTQLSNLYLLRLSISCTNHAWMLCVCSCVILQLADVGTNGGAAFQRAGE
jgi:hypothetical protein